WYAVLAPITTSPGRRSGFRPPAIPVKRTWVGWNCSTSRVAAMAAFTFPIPEWASTTFLSFKLPVVNRIPWTVISVLSVSSRASVSISRVIALRTAMTRVVGAGRGVLPTWATLAAESSRRRKEKTKRDLRIALIVGPCCAAARRRPWRTLFWRRGSAQFLKTRVLAQRFEHRIEPEQRRSERRICGERRFVWD